MGASPASRDNNAPPGNLGYITFNLPAPSTAPFDYTIQRTFPAPASTTSSGIQANSSRVRFLGGPSMPGQRVDYVSTEDTPYAAVYDDRHLLIFASNPAFNRVDVISTISHKVVRHIAVPDPRGIDITQDHSTVWVGTSSRQVFAIDTTTLARTRYQVPAGTAGYWEDMQVYTLADGTVLLQNGILGFGYSSLAVWDPTIGSVSILHPPAAYGFVRRSGDGKRLYFFDDSSAGRAFYYDVLAQTYSAVVTIGAYEIEGAVNFDGTRVEICDYVNGAFLYDGEFNPIGPVPGCGGGGGAYGNSFSGGPVFSPDNFLYAVLLPWSPAIPFVATVDARNANTLSLAPAIGMIPVQTSLSPPFLLGNPFAADNSGVVMGIQDWGISFDDSTYTHAYSSNQPGAPTYLQHMSPYFGPLSGGTTSGGFGNAFPSHPGVSAWYGSNRGTANIDNGGSLTVTSPPTQVGGPVNLKILFSDGTMTYDPLFFSYGPVLQYALQSGAPPAGNVTAQVVGYGLPSDNISGTLKIGNSTATLTSGNTGLPLAGTPYPNKVLSYTVPPGPPGLADITITTPQGTSTLPKAFLYAQSVTDYPSSDSFTAVLLDRQRQQLYLSAGDHIDVFSLASHQFLTPLTPPAQGTTKQFAGLALTPDGSLLLITDLMDGSLAVVNPDDPSSSYAIPIAPPSNSTSPTCWIGPLYVTATTNNQAWVIMGGIAAIGCGPGGSLYVADLNAHTSSRPPVPAAGTCSLASSAAYISATRDGTKVAIGGFYGDFCVYNVASGTYTSNSSFRGGADFAGDGNVGATTSVFFDAASNLVGHISRPHIYYDPLDSYPQIFALIGPRINDTGSLYYVAYPNFFDVIDVQHGNLRMRFALPETITLTAAPMALDASGRVVYLITNKGLTIVDLGKALLSIGWFDQTSVSAGMQVKVRGSGFDNTITATLNGQNAVVAVADESTLTLTVPAVASGPATLVLTRGDGSTYNLEGALTVP